MEQRAQIYNYPFLAMESLRRKFRVQPHHSTAKKAQLLDLPHEILQEIIFYVLLSDQCKVITSPASMDPQKANYDPNIAYHNHLASLSLHNFNSRSLTAEISQLHDLLKWKRHDYGSASESLFDIYTDFYDYNHRKDLLKLSLTCRYLHDVVEPLLYRNVKYKRPTSGNMNQLLSLTRWKSEQLSMIRCLSLRVRTFGDPWQPADFYDSQTLQGLKLCAERITRTKIPTNRVRTRNSKRLHDQVMSSLWAMPLVFMPGLVAIRIHLDYTPLFLMEFLNLYPDLTKAPVPKNLQKLQEFSLVWEYPRRGSAIHSSFDPGALSPMALIPLFLLPAIRKLHFSHTSLSYPEDADPTQMLQYAGLSNVTELILNMTVMHLSILTEILSLPHALESFTYTYYTYGPNYHHPRPKFDGGVLGTALLAQASSLKKLVLRGPDLYNYTTYEIPITNFKYFTVLDELHISLGVIADGAAQLLNQKLIFSNLPPALTKFYLYVPDNWSVEEWTSTVIQVLDSKDTLAPKLQYLRIEYRLGDRETRNTSPEEREWILREVLRVGRVVGVETIIVFDGVLRIHSPPMAQKRPAVSRPVPENRRSWSLNSCSVQ